MYNKTSDTEEQMDSSQIEQDSREYGRIPKLFIMPIVFIPCKEDIQKAYRIEMVEKNKWNAISPLSF